MLTSSLHNLTQKRDTQSALASPKFIRPFSADSNADRVLSQLRSHHLAEWQASGIAVEITAANLQSIDGQDFIERILGNTLDNLGAHAQQYATAEYQRLVNRHQGAIEDGGWLCTGLDLSGIISLAQQARQTGDLGDAEWQHLLQDIDSLPQADWGCFKPDTPRYAWKHDANGQWVETDKPIKYEHPHGVSTSAFFLASSLHPRLWLDALASIQDKPIILVEGAKKAACLITLDYIAIGLPGVTQWNKPQTRELIDELALFARKGREVYICFDQDSKATTRRNVGAEIFKLSAALRRKRCTVHIISWHPSLGKGVDDLIVSHGPTAFEQAYDAAARFEYWAIQQLSQLSYQANWICPEGQRYLNGIPFPEDAKFIAIKAPKGTGKTEELKRLIDQALAEGRPVLLLSHRVQLTQALCDRTNIPSIYEVLAGGDDTALLAYLQGFGLCVPSLHPDSQAQFKPEDWRNALIILDEAEQVLWEILNSDTCKQHRVAILKSLRTLIRGALSPETDGRLVLADADLSDLSVNFMRGIVGDHAPAPWVALSHYKDTVYDLNSYESIEALLLDTERRLANSEKLWVITDSQKPKGRFSSTALEARWRRCFPLLRILRIDSHTLQCKDAPAFGAIARLNALAGDYDVVIVSPSVETGVSLDLRGHFDRVVGFFQGVMPENSVRQSLIRLREPVPRDIYLAPRGLSFIGGGEVVASALEASQDKQVSAALTLIFDAGRDEIESNFLPIATRTWSKFATRQNAAMAAYRLVTLAGLEAEGHRLQVILKPEKGSPDAEAHQHLGEQLNVDRHLRLRDQGEAIAQSVDLPPAEVDKLEQAHSLDNEAQARALKKAQLKRKYPGVEVTPDLFILDEYSWHPKLKLHYALTLGRDHVKQNDRAKVEALLHDGAVWGADIKRATLSVKVHMLEYFNIPALLELDRISDQHPLLIELADSALQHTKEIKAALGFTLSLTDRPVVVARKFLNVVGYGLGKVARIGPRGQQVRHYPIEPIDYKELANFGPEGYDSKATRYESDRRPIFEAWLARDEGKMAAVMPPDIETAVPVVPEPLKIAEPTTEIDLQVIVIEDSVVTAGKDLIDLPMTTDYRLQAPRHRHQNGNPWKRKAVLFRLTSSCRKSCPWLEKSGPLRPVMPRLKSRMLWLRRLLSTEPFHRQPLALLYHPADSPTVSVHRRSWSNDSGEFKSLGASHCRQGCKPSHLGGDDVHCVAPWSSPLA